MSHLTGWEPLLWASLYWFLAAGGCQHYLSGVAPPQPGSTWCATTVSAGCPLVLPPKRVSCQHACFSYTKKLLSKYHCGGQNVRIPCKICGETEVQHGLSEQVQVRGSAPVGRERSRGKKTRHKQTTTLIKHQICWQFNSQNLLSGNFFLCENHLLLVRRKLQLSVIAEFNKTGKWEVWKDQILESSSEVIAPNTK